MQDWLNQRPTRLAQVLRIVIACNLLAAAVALAAPEDDEESELRVADSGIEGGASSSTDDTVEGDAASQPDGGLTPAQLNSGTSVSTTAKGGTSSTQPGKGSSTTTGPGGTGGGGGATRRIAVAPGTHGVTDTVIQLGMVDADVGSTVDAINGAGGTSGGASSSPTGGVPIRTAVNTIVKYINANGGLAGRNIEMVWAPVDAAKYLQAASARQGEQQRACSTFTEDNHVFSFSAIAMSEELVFECARKSQTPMVATGY